MRRAARVDENQAAIVRELLDRHVSVQVLSAVGGGCPDLLVAHSHVNLLVELKNPAQYPNKRKLRPLQQEFHRTWRGPVIVAETSKQILAALYRLAA